MSKRALVIGSEVFGLRGTENDARAVQDALVERGFSVELRLGARASRAGILEGLAALIAAAEEGDAAVVYYAGHGAYTRSPELGDPRRFQALVPTDWGKTTAADYRGLSTWELSCNLRRLTAKTRNAVLILDCCHSSQMCRDGEVAAARVRALPDPAVTSFAAHAEALQELYGEAPEILKPAWSNPDLVCLVACGRSEAAHEMENERGLCRGVFTEALLDLLAHADDDSLSWDLLGQAVRQRVMRIFPSQRPDLEGPRQRRLFSLLEDRGGGTTLITGAPDGRTGLYHLHEGRLHGVSVNDVYSVMPPGSSAFEASKELARAVVAIAQATSSEVLIKEWRNGRTAIPDDAVAIPRERMAPRHPVTVIAPPHDLPELEKALAATRTLRPAPAAPGASDELGEPPLATLRLSNHQLTVEDASGPLFPPWSYPRGLAAAIAPLTDLAAARGLKALEGAHGLSERLLDLELGVLHQRRYVRIRDRGATLGNADRLFIKLKNRSQQRIYVNVFNLGMRGSVALLSAFAPSGIALDPKDEYVLGQSDATGSFEGLELLWPNGLPTTSGPRLDEVIAVVTTKPVSLHALQTRRGESRAVQRGGGGLRDRLAQLYDGAIRDVSFAERDDFMVKSLSFFLDPREVSLAAGEAERSLHAAVTGEAAASPP